MTDEQSEPKSLHKYIPIGSSVQAIANATGISNDVVEEEILRRLTFGLIRTKASRQRVVVKNRYGIVIETEDTLESEIPVWVWTHCFHQKEQKQDWLSGVFFVECHVDKQFKDVTLFGVELCMSDIAGIPEILHPGSGQIDFSDDRKTRAGGRGKSDTWPDWIAELALYLHEHGIPEGSGVNGQDELIDAVESRLIERGASTLGRTTVQPVVRAVLQRLRSAGN